MSCDQEQTDFFCYQNGIQNDDKSRKFFKFPVNAKYNGPGNGSTKSSLVASFRVFDLILEQVSKQECLSALCHALL